MFVKVSTWPVDGVFTRFWRTERKLSQADKLLQDTGVDAGVITGSGRPWGRRPPSPASANDYAADS